MLNANVHVDEGAEQPQRNEDLGAAQHPRHAGAPGVAQEQAANQCGESAAENDDGVHGAPRCVVNARCAGLSRQRDTHASLGASTG